MNLDQNELVQVFEGLAVSGVRTMLWDSDDVLVYVDPGMQDLYKSKEFQKSFGKVDLTAGMSWLDWTKKEIDLGIIEIPNDMNEQSYLKKLKKERIEIKDKRTRELTFSNGTTILSTDVRLSTGVGILICDLVGFTAFCEENTPEDVVMELEQVFGLFERVFEEHSIEKLKTVGDAIVGASGISDESDEPVYDIARCAIKLKELSINKEIRWDLHLGIHFGPMVAGVIGKKTKQFDFLGKTVNTAFNICDLSVGNDILISNDAWMRSRNDIKVKSIGAQKLKGGHSMEIFKCLEVV
jgi:class 3 adenylate cyclase